MKTPEWYEKRDIDAYLESIGAYIVKPTTMGFGKSGVPDRIFCYRGRFGSVEVKREGKQPTKLQWERINDIATANGSAFWGTAKNVIADIKGWICLIK